MQLNTALIFVFNIKSLSLTYASLNRQYECLVPDAHFGMFGPTFMLIPH